RNLLSARLSTPLAATLMFDHPTVDDIADHLAGLVPAERVPLPAAPTGAAAPAGAAAWAGAAPAGPAPVPSTSDGSPTLVPVARGPAEPMAVIGMACRFPGGVRDP